MKDASSATHEDGKPLLAFDQDCHLCRGAVTKWRADGKDQVTYRSLGEVAPYVAVPRRELDRSIHLFMPDGSHRTGACAVFTTWSIDRGRPGWLWSYEHVPLFKPLSELVYFLISRYRHHHPLTGQS